MDGKKRKALIEWINALVPDCSICSLLDLKDGKGFIRLLELSDECIVPDLEAPQNVEDRFRILQQYLEGFFSLKDNPGSKLLNFECFHQKNHKELEWDLGKILLALMEACVLEKKNDDFVKTAMSLPESIQLEIMQMLHPMIINSQDIGNHLTEDFADILTKCSDTNAHQDAALFFQLVTQGKLNMSQVTSTPIVDQSFNFSRFSNHVASPVPYHHPVNTSLGASLHEIASPLRMLTIANSPVTPLGALMHSPQLAQKALIRQKEREIKKLELSLQNERHLRTELEFDIHEKTELLNEKDNKIKEFDKVLRQHRKVQDTLDEIDNLRMEREKSERDVARMQSKLNELQNIKENSIILENENKQLSEDLSKMRTEVQTFESLKKSHEEYRTQCHLQLVKLQEMETLIKHRNSEVECKQRELCDSEERRQSLISQINTLRKEKEEMEEFLSCRDLVNGESMGVISDKRIKELEEEMSQMKTSWFEPSQYEHLHQQLIAATEAKKTFEEKYISVHKMFLEKDSETDQLQFDISQLKLNITSLENTRDELEQKVKGLETDLDTLRQSESRLVTAEESATTARKVAEEQVLCLQKDLSRLQSELKLTIQELESTKVLNENRRQTLAASYDVALTEKATSEHRLFKENSKLEEQVTELKTKLQVGEEERAKLEESLNTKMQSLQSSSKQTEILLENEKWTKNNVITAMKEEIKELQDELVETENRLQAEVTKLTEVKCNLDDQIVQQKNSYVVKIDQINEEFSSYKLNSRQKEKDLCNKIQDFNDENISLKNEIENFKSRTETLTVTLEQKYSKFENKAKEQEDSLNKELKALQDKYQWSLHDQQTLSDEISDLKENNKEKCLEIESLHCETVNYKQIENDLKGQLSQVTNSKESIQKQLEKLRQDLASERDSHDDLLTKISQEHQIEIQKLKESLSSKEASSLDTRQNLEACINEMQTSLEKEIEKGKENERLSSVKVVQFEKQLSELHQTIDEESNSHNVTVTSLNNELEQLRMTTAVSEEMLNKELLKCQSDLQRITTECDELNTRYKSVTENERTLDSRLNELHQQISTLETQRKHSDKHKEEMKEKINDLTGQIALIKKVAESKQADNDKLYSENKNLNMKVEELNDKLLKECKENDAMRHKSKEQTNHVTCLESELSEVNTQLTDALQTLEEKSSSLGQEVETVSLRDEEIDNLKKSLQNYTEKANASGEQVVKLCEDNSELSEKVENLNNELKKLQNVFTCEKGEQNEKLHVLMESHKCEIDELKKSSEEESRKLTNEIDKLKLDVLSCDAEIHRLEVEIKNLKSAIEVLKEQHMQEKESMCVGNEVTVNSYETKISDIHENFSKERNEIVESHEAKFDSLNSEYISSKEHYENTLQEVRDQARRKAELLRNEYQEKIDSLNGELTTEREKLETLKTECGAKISETEKYWQTQLQQLEEEYHRASQEQKQEYHDQIQEQEIRFQSQYEALVQEKEMILSNQKLAFQDRVKQLETRLLQKQNEVSLISKEMNEDKEKVETDYKQKLSNIESILKKVMANQKDSVNELKQNKERVNELQSALREKRTSYEASLAASSKSWENEIESLREEYNNNMSQLEREKNRQVEEEKQRRSTLEESCHHLNERIEASMAENNSYKQQLAAVEEEKNQLILDYERTLDQKTNNYEDQEKLKKKIEFLKSQVQKLEIESSFHKDQLDCKVKDMKEEIAYTEKHWSEELESCKKQYSEAYQQKTHLQQQMKNIEEDTAKKDQIIMNYKKHYAQKKEMNQMLQQEVSVHMKLAENFKNKAENLEAEMSSMKLNYKRKSEKLENELELLKVKIEEQSKKFNKSEADVAPTKAQLQEELNKNKALQNKVNCMEVQLEYADKQVRDFRHKLDEAGTALLGDNTEFLKMKKESDVSLMETSLHEDGGPLTPYELRSKSRKHSLDRNTSQMSLRHHSNSDGDEKIISPMSLRSHGRRTSFSDPNLNSTIASMDSIRSTTTRGMKRFVNDEDDEGEVLEWKRLGELSRRNTLCPAHLKTSYPVETQKIQLRAFPDKQLKESHMNQDNLKKRKQEMIEEDDVKTEFYDSSKPKQAKHGTVYHKPGPPTPGNTNRRNSRGTPGKSLHSPRSPLTIGGRKRTPKRTPKKTEPSNENLKPSTTFSIGFTPKNKRLTRQQGFVSSASKSTSKGHRHRQPLAVKNCFQQTGV